MQRKEKCYLTEQTCSEKYLKTLVLKLEIVLSSLTHHQRHPINVQDGLVESVKYLTRVRATTTDFFTFHSLQSLIDFFPQYDFLSAVL